MLCFDFFSPKVKKQACARNFWCSRHCAGCFKCVISLKPGNNWAQYWSLSSLISKEKDKSFSILFELLTQVLKTGIQTGRVCFFFLTLQFIYFSSVNKHHWPEIFQKENDMPNSCGNESINLRKTPNTWMLLYSETSSRLWALYHLICGLCPPGPDILFKTSTGAKE